MAIKLAIFAFMTILVSLVTIAQASEEDPESPLERYFKSADLVSGDLDDEWIDIRVAPLNKRDGSSMSKRSSSTTRESSPFFVKRHAVSNPIVLPNSLSEASQMTKRDTPQHVRRNVKHDKRGRKMSVNITWYDGEDLLNPSCVQNSKWAPTRKSMVGAVTILWPNKPSCGSFVKITHKDKPKVFVVVRIVDSCGGCAPYTGHIDLTPAAFEKLYDADVGFVGNLRAQVVKPPAKHTWTKGDVARYGPRQL